VRRGRHQHPLPGRLARAAPALSTRHGAPTMFELVLRVPQARVEPLSDALVDELGALAVSVEDADAGTGAEHALFGEPGMPAPAPGWARSTLVALFDDEASADAAAARLLAEHGAAAADGGLALQAMRELPDQDW